MSDSLSMTTITTEIRKWQKKGSYVCTCSMELKTARHVTSSFPLEPFGLLPLPSSFALDCAETSNWFGQQHILWPVTISRDECELDQTPEALGPLYSYTYSECIMELKYSNWGVLWIQLDWALLTVTMESNYVSRLRTNPKQVSTDIPTVCTSTRTGPTQTSQHLQGCHVRSSVGRFTATSCPWFDGPQINAVNQRRRWRTLLLQSDASVIPGTSTCAVA